MLSIKTIHTLNNGESHTIIGVVENFTNGSVWYLLKELLGEDIRYLKKLGYNPYIEDKNIPQDILKKILL
jgi:hypothetical protein